MSLPTKYIVRRKPFGHPVRAMTGASNGAALILVTWRKEVTSNLQNSGQIKLQLKHCELRLYVCHRTKKSH
jgi:hypothetical protein